MYPSISSSGARRSVNTAVGWPGSGETASSLTARPGRSTLSVERGPLRGAGGGAGGSRGKRQPKGGRALGQCAKKDIHARRAAHEQTDE
jgi:hypothetical protein